MHPLNLPPFDIKISQKNGRTQVYDFLRKRYITLTPEEWVRQHFIHYLIEGKGYPAALMMNEVGITVGGVERRCDSILYHKAECRPRMIMEYKAPHIRITQDVFMQAASYNSVLRADYLTVSNGLTHYCCRINYEENRTEFLQAIPDYKELV